MITLTHPIREDALDIVNSNEIALEKLSRMSAAFDERAESLAADLRDWRNDLANASGTGLSSSTAPKVAALRVSIPFAGEL